MLIQWGKSAHKDTVEQPSIQSSVSPQPLLGCSFPETSILQLPLLLPHLPLTYLVILRNRGAGMLLPLHSKASGCHLSFSQLLVKAGRFWMMWAFWNLQLERWARWLEWTQMDFPSRVLTEKGAKAGPRKVGDKKAVCEPLTFFARTGIQLCRKAHSSWG